MMRRTRRLAHVTVWTLLLGLAIGTDAASALPGTGSVDSGDIKDGQVRTLDLGGSVVTSAKIADGTVTGADVKESTLAKVPAASRSDYAGDLTMRKIVVTPTKDTVHEPVLVTGAGLTVTLSCSLVNDSLYEMSFNLRPLGDNGRLTVTIPGSPYEKSYDEDFDSTELQSAVAMTVEGSWPQWHVMYQSAAGKVAVLDLSPGFASPDGCAGFGTMMFG